MKKARKRVLGRTLAKELSFEELKEISGTATVIWNCGALTVVELFGTPSTNGMDDKFIDCAESPYVTHD